MGGRGSLSSKAHSMYDKKSIYTEMKKSGVEVYGLNHVSRKGLSIVVEALETVQHLQKKHGKMIDSVIIGVDRNSDFAFRSSMVLKSKKGPVDLGRTLIIPKRTVQHGKADMQRNINKANVTSYKYNKVNFVVAKNVKQMIYHEFGHAIHHALKVTDPTSYAEFERRFAVLVKQPKARVNLSKYASTKAYKGKIGSHEYVAESVTHILRNSKTRKGQDMVDLVWDYMSRVPSVNFSRYGKRNAPKVKTTRPGRPRQLKRKRKKQTGV